MGIPSGRCWEKSDTRITLENVKDFGAGVEVEVSFSYARTGPRSLTPPVIVGLLISYRGFKELAFVADDSGTVWSVDADLNRVFWKRQFEPGSDEAVNRRTSVCGTKIPLASMPALQLLAGGVRAAFRGWTSQAGAPG